MTTRGFDPLTIKTTFALTTWLILGVACGQPSSTPATATPPPAATITTASAPQIITLAMKTLDQGLLQPAKVRLLTQHSSLTNYTNWINTVSGALRYNQPLPVEFRSIAAAAQRELENFAAQGPVSGGDLLETARSNPLQPNNPYIANSVSACGRDTECQQGIIQGKDLLTAGQHLVSLFLNQPPDVRQAGSSYLLSNYSLRALASAP